MSQIVNENPQWVLMVELFLACQSLTYKIRKICGEIPTCSDLRDHASDHGLQTCEELYNPRLLI